LGPPRWSTDVERVGSAETLTITFKPGTPGEGAVPRLNFGGVHGLTVDYREDGELLVYNRGDDKRGFAICLQCGYAESEVKLGRGRVDLPAGFDRHPPITSTKPWDICLKADGPTPMRNQVLAAKETTDVLLLDFTNCLGTLAEDEALIKTLAYAFQRAATGRLELDPREIGVLVVPTGRGGKSRGAVLFDNVPGGAGHVGELLDQGKEWLRDARQVLYIDSAHDQRCDSACLDCLLSFDAQMSMEQHPFIRRHALVQLDRLLALTN
jgi:DEAD/DEAH box helicase domain-containing protein